ncbi:hypothetical protein GGF46_000544 [Coemansia sp. RSA 552]|nr:hypothetical protein GGF46_000544 [Coemansia sp. RSA 552]
MPSGQNQPPEVRAGQHDPERNTLVPPLQHGDQYRDDRMGDPWIPEETDDGGDDDEHMGGEYGDILDANDQLEDHEADYPEDQTPDPAYLSDTYGRNVGGMEAMELSPPPLLSLAQGYLPTMNGQPEHIIINTQGSPLITGEQQQFGTAQGPQPHVLVEDTSPQVTPQPHQPSVFQVSPQASVTGSSPGSPGRKHRRRGTAQTPGSTESSNKRPRIHPPVESPESRKLGMAALLNPESNHKDNSSSPPPIPRSRILFKCAVCLDTPDPAVFVQPCGHVFCEACAQGAVQTTMRCPVCRHSMRLRDIRVLQFRLAEAGRKTS